MEQFGMPNMHGVVTYPDGRQVYISEEDRRHWQQAQYQTAMDPVSPYYWSPAPGLPLFVPNQQQSPMSQTTAMVANASVPHSEPMSRSMSVVSDKSAKSADSSSSEKTACPECGKYIKDMKAHLLTHGDVRPFRCPVESCKYGPTGFARKWDGKRHIINHYVGLWICPEPQCNYQEGGNGAVWKFKNHLRDKHGCQARNNKGKANTLIPDPEAQNDPDAKRCNTCGVRFRTFQVYHDHVDECATYLVNNPGPAEAHNASNIGAVENDPEVLATLERNNVSLDAADADNEDDEDDEDDLPEEDGEAGKNLRTGKGSIKKSSRVSKKGRPGLTYSKGGIRRTGPAASANNGRKKRGQYPPEWGTDPSNMRMKKRVATAWDGPHRLSKDEMMMDNRHMVWVPTSSVPIPSRVPNLEPSLDLPIFPAVEPLTPPTPAYGNSSEPVISDLDVMTVARLDAFHDALPEEKGVYDPLLADNIRRPINEIDTTWEEPSASDWFLQELQAGRVSVFSDDPIQLPL